MGRHGVPEFGLVPVRLGVRGELANSDVASPAATHSAKYTGSAPGHFTGTRRLSSSNQETVTLKLDTRQVQALRRCTPC